LPEFYSKLQLRKDISNIHDTGRTRTALHSRMKSDWVQQQVIRRTICHPLSQLALNGRNSNSKIQKNVKVATMCDW